MYQNFNPALLGVSGRQSEIIELAMTYQFQGLDVEVEEFLEACEQRGLEHAARFLVSAGLKISGGQLPLDWTATDGPFAAALNRLSEQAAHLAAIQLQTLYVEINPLASELPYHENFELHRTRLTQIANVLQPHGISLALGFSAPAVDDPVESGFIRDAQAMSALLRTIDAENIGLLLDTWDWHVSGGTLAQLQELGANRVVGVRVADLATTANVAAAEDVASASGHPQAQAAEAEADTADEATESVAADNTESAAEPLAPRQRALPTTDGTIPHTQLLEWLASADYAGPVTVAVRDGVLPKIRRERLVQTASAALEALIGSVSNSLQEV